MRPMLTVATMLRQVKHQTPSRHDNFPAAEKACAHLHMGLPLCVRIVLWSLCKLLGDHKGAKGQLTSRQRGCHTAQLFMHCLNNLCLGLTCRWDKYQKDFG